MQLPQFKKQKFRWNYTAMAFLLPFTIMAVIYFISSVTPFGSYTLLYSDNYHQYYPFFRQFREAIRSGSGLQWTWSVGGGMDYLGLISYYLASPLNLLSILVPDSMVLTYFTWLMPVKLSLASLFFAIMLKKLFGRDDLSLPLFGSFYGFCAWALGYQWNIMWLDSFALLPLVALGTVLLLRERKYLLYTLTLALAVLSNYYIGLFVCIFVFLLFWCYEICRFQSIRRSLADLFFIGVFTVLALGLTAVLEIPTLASLQTTYSSSSSFPSGFQLNLVSSDAQAAAKTAWAAYKTAKEEGSASFSLWFAAIRAAFPAVMDGMRQVAGQIGGGQSPTYIDGMPNLYCGVFPIALVFLFLLSDDVRLRDKLCGAGLLVLFMLSILFRQLDYVWNGFHFTNQIPYRFSFLFSFVMLYMAYRAWLLRDTFPLWKIIGAGLLSLCLLLYGNHDRSDILYWLFNFVFLFIYILCMTVAHPQYWHLSNALTSMSGASDQPVPETEAEQEPIPETNAETAADTAVDGSPDTAEEVTPAPRRKKFFSLRDDRRRRQFCSMVLAITMTLELVLFSVLFVFGFSIADWDYPKNEKNAAVLFRKIDELDDGKDLFYRTEVTHAQTLNDGALNGYNGITTFSSSANLKMTEFMRLLGASAYGSWNRYCYEESSPVSNLFLNLKYLVERDGEVDGNRYFDPVLSENGMTVLKNNAYLPLGFLAEAELADLATDIGSGFTFQNALFQAATGLSGTKNRVWSTVAGNDLAVTVTDEITIKSSNIGGYTSFSTGTQDGTMSYTYTVSKEGFMCLNLDLGRQKNFSVLLNGKQLYSSGFSLSQVVAVGDVQPGDVVELQIKCHANQSSASVYVTAAILNEEIYRQGYDILSASTLQLTQFDTTRFCGTIDCNRDGLLYTSIPQNGYWEAYVDGQKAQIVLVGDCMVSVMLEEGSHTVEFVYRNTALRFGALITLGCAFVLAGIVVTDHCIRRRRKNRP